MIKENSVLGYKPVCPKKTSRGKRIDRIEFYYTYNLYSTKLLHINKKRYLICYSKARLFCCETPKKKVRASLKIQAVTLSILLFFLN
jgi:hypothetical protein